MIIASFYELNVNYPFGTQLGWVEIVVLERSSLFFWRDCVLGFWVHVRPAATKRSSRAGLIDAVTGSSEEVRESED